MRIKINAMELNNGLKKAMLGTNKKVLEICGSILLTVADDNVTLTSSSLKSGIQVNLSSVRIIESGSIIIKESDLKLIQKLKGEIEISADSDNNVIYKANRTLSSKIDDTPEDFPKFPNKDFIELFEVPALQFKDSCKIKKMASKEDTRPTLTGLAIAKNHMVTCDGYRIARIKLDIENDKTVIIPLETITLLEKVIDKKDTSILKFSLSDDEKILLIKNDDYTVFTTLIEGDYLNVSQTIPNDKEISIKIDRKELIESLEFIKVAIGAKVKDTPTRLYIDSSDSNKLKIEVILKDKTINESIEIVNHDYMKNDFKAGYNFNYPLEAIKMMQDDEIRIDFIGELQPMMVYSNDMVEQHLILPMRVRDWAVDKDKKSA